MGRHPYQVVPPAPTYGRVVAVDFLNGVEKIVKPEIARWIPPSELVNGSWEDSFNKELRTLTLENGSNIEFMSYDQDTDKFAGTSRDWVWLDEEMPREIYVECWLRLLDRRGVLWMTLTPLDGMSSWIYDEIYVASRTDPKIDVFHVDITDNPYLNQIEIEAIFSGLTDEEREARAHGKFVQLGGLIYKMFSDKNIIDPLHPPEDWMHVAGMDHGFANPTAWLWVAIDPLGRIVVYDEYYKSGQIISYHAEKVHEMNALHEREPDYYVGDPSIRNTDPITGTSVLIEYVNHGIPIVLGNNDVKAGIDQVAKRLIGIGEAPNNIPELYITRNCVHTIREHERYRWRKWATRAAREEKNKPEEPVKRDDHTCDALRYVVASRPRYDEGTQVPENSLPQGASSPVEAYDSPVAVGDYSSSGDYHMGSEY